MRVADAWPAPVATACKRGGVQFLLSVCQGTLADSVVPCGAAGLPINHLHVDHLRLPLRPPHLVYILFHLHFGVRCRAVSYCTISLSDCPALTCKALRIDLHGHSIRYDLERRSESLRGCFVAARLLCASGKLIVLRLHLFNSLLSRLELLALLGNYSLQVLNALIYWNVHDWRLALLDGGVGR